MMDKPPYIDEIVLLDPEEAEVLVKAGVRVWFDYYNTGEIPLSNRSESNGRGWLKDLQCIKRYAMYFNPYNEVVYSIEDIKSLGEKGIMFLLKEDNDCTQVSP